MRRLIALFLVVATSSLATEPALREQIGALFRERKWTDAQILVEQAVAAEPANAEARFYLGVCFLNRNDAEHALPPLEKAVELEPTNANYVRHLGDAYGLTAQKAGLFSKIGWAKKCKAAYDKAVELDPKDINARWSVMEFCRQAPGFLGGGLDAAYAQAAEIKKLDPPRGRIAYTKLYLSEKKFSEAFALYEDALKEKPDDFETLYQIGNLADTSGQQFDRGLAVLRKCLSLPAPNPQGYAATHWRIGNILAKQGDKNAARNEYEAALAADPKFTSATESLAKLN